MMTTLGFLSKESIQAIHSVSLQILETTGIKVENPKALELLSKSGCVVEGQSVKVPSSLVKNALQKVPKSFDLYTRDGKKSYTIGSDNVVFNPGSSAVYYKDWNSGTIRKGTSKDIVALTKLVDRLEHIKLQSTALIASDVPETVSDFHRLFLSLKFSSKPIVTGAFRKEGVPDMEKLLASIVGNPEALTEKPIAIFDCCPLSPLVWSDLSCQNLLDCASARIPAEIVPAPLMGATSPITLNGTIVQASVETLSGIVIAQLANPGTPVIYGGAPGSFDMKYATPRFGAVEALVVACALAEMGKYYGVPTHGYLGASDSKIEDSQSGFESALGIMLGALTRVNVVSGPGMLGQLNCQSLEKLVIDNEICGSAYRLTRGIDLEDLDVVANLLEVVGPGGNYLGQKHTSKRFRSEHIMPSNVLCRLMPDKWLESGSKTAQMRANEKVSSLLQDYTYEKPENLAELENAYDQLAKKYSVA
jgi:trimethylamine--corrinoid protein Co-methyltransferase